MHCNLSLVIVLGRYSIHGDTHFIYEFEMIKLIIRANHKPKKSFKKENNAQKNF